MSNIITPPCGHGAYKDYHINNQIWHCRYCLMSGVLTNYKLSDFAPFNSYEEALDIATKMRVSQVNFYEAIRTQFPHKFPGLK